MCPIWIGFIALIARNINDEDTFLAVFREKPIVNAFRTIKVLRERAFFAIHSKPFAIFYFFFWFALQQSATNFKTRINLEWKAIKQFIFFIPWRDDIHTK